VGSGNDQEKININLNRQLESLTLQLEAVKSDKRMKIESLQKQMDTDKLN